jgi:hypothetical protein
MATVTVQRSACDVLTAAAANRFDLLADRQPQPVIAMTLASVPCLFWRHRKRLLVATWT